MADVVCGGESASLVAAAWFMNERNDPMKERAKMASTNDDAPMRPWQWWVSGLLLLATMINYMDRLTLANLSVRITEELSLSQERYGDLELAFGWAFAVGSLVFGILADRFPVRWLYPAVVIGWSAVGLLTGVSSGYGSMLVCRTMLGFFEAGHWPCALRTTQAVLSRKDRLLGNSLLQSGGAIGAIITPLVISWMVGNNMAVGAWRPPFIVIGAIGAVWVVGWLLTIRSSDLAVHKADSDGPAPSLGTVWWEECVANRRFWTLIPLVVAVNITWQVLRAWLPKFLQQGRGATEAESLFFNAFYYGAADVGCIAAGAASLWLVKRGLTVHRSRLIVAAACAACAAFTILAARLPLGYGLYGVLLLIGAGAMGLFPCYYSFAQDVSPRHLGKASGLLAAIGWLIASPIQKAFGRLIDQTGSFDTGITLAGLAPAVAIAAIMIFWPHASSADAERS
jgi:ACS family hexuronate transporter-like MFS transporter